MVGEGEFYESPEKDQSSVGSGTSRAVAVVVVEQHVTQCGVWCLDDWFVLCWQSCCQI